MELIGYKIKLLEKEFVYRSFSGKSEISSFDLNQSKEDHTWKLIREYDHFISKNENENICQWMKWYLDRR